MHFCPNSNILIINPNTMYQLTTTSKRKKNLAVYTNSEGRRYTFKSCWLIIKAIEVKQYWPPIFVFFTRKEEDASPTMFLQYDNLVL